MLDVAVNTWAGKTPPAENSVGLIAYRFEVPEAEVLYSLSHRAPLLGYVSSMETDESAWPLLRLCDPNGNWLEMTCTDVSAADHPASSGTSSGAKS